MEAVVRIPEAGMGIIKQLLDSGIQNIIIPKVESGEETESIMYWASYAPRGNRGFGVTAVRAGRYGRHAADLGVSSMAFGADTAFLAAAADNTLETFTKDIKR